MEAKKYKRSLPHARRHSCQCGFGRPNNQYASKTLKDAHDSFEARGGCLVAANFVAIVVVVAMTQFAIVIVAYRHYCMCLCALCVLCLWSQVVCYVVCCVFVCAYCICCCVACCCFCMCGVFAFVVFTLCDLEKVVVMLHVLRRHVV